MRRSAMLRGARARKCASPYCPLSSPRQTSSSRTERSSPSTSASRSPRPSPSAAIASSLSAPMPRSRSSRRRPRGASTCAGVRSFLDSSTTTCTSRAPERRGSGKCVGMESGREPPRSRSCARARRRSRQANGSTTSADGRSSSSPTIRVRSRVRSWTRSSRTIPSSCRPRTTRLTSIVAHCRRWASMTRRQNDAVVRDSAGQPDRPDHRSGLPRARRQDSRRHRPRQSKPARSA